jgi:simple sugar transport system permease protein
LLEFKLVERERPSRLARLAAPAAAILTTAAFGAVLFALLGKPPLAVFDTFFFRPVEDLYGLGELLIKAAPLALCATGLAIGFRGNVWNIGAEGQLIMGAIAGGGLAIAFPETEAAWLLPLMVVAGAAGGSAWAAIPAFLKTRFNANEILTSLMLTYVAALFLGYLVHGPWRDPAGFNFPESRIFADAATWPVLMEGTRLHAGVLLVPFVTLAAWLLIKRSFLGFQVAVTGYAPDAASYAGFSASRVVWLGMLSGGITAGLAGVGEVAGPIGQLLPEISPGYGFAAIIVAFLGRLEPVGILLASVLMALVYLGGEAAQVDLGLSPAITGLFQGVMLMTLLAAELFVRYRPVSSSTRAAGLEAR